MSRLVLLLAVLSVAAGCASQPLVELRPQPYNPLAERLKLTARGGPRPGARTRQFLRQHDLPERLGMHPADLVQAVAEVHRQEPTAESCYALAELSYVAARKLQLRHPQQALELDFHCVAQAYSFLFDLRYEQERNPYDPEFRQACDLYNSALENCLRAVRRRGDFQPGEAFAFDLGNRTVEVSIEPRGFNWSADDYDSFEFVSDYELKGLKNEYRTYGLGVPLIAVRRRGAAPPEFEQFYAPGLSFPVTAFLRLEPWMAR